MVPVNLQITDSRWADFICKHPDATIFHHPAWAGLLAECYRYKAFVLTVNDARGEILCGLPAIKLNSPFQIKCWSSLPFTDYCFPLAKEDALIGKFTELLIERNQSNNYKSFEIRSPIHPGNGVHIDEQFVLHTLQLDPKPETLFDKFERKFRQYPRKAEREGLHVVSANSYKDMELFYNIHLKTRVKLGVPIQPKKYFRLLWERIIMEGLGKVILVADKNEKPISGAILLYFKKNAMIKYSASDPAYLDTRCHYFTFWKCIEWACLNGMDVIDFGKTEVYEEGLRKFKSGWGAEEKPLSYSYIGGKPPKVSANPLMKPLRKIIQHSPPWVCRVIGELFYKYAA